MASLPAPHRAPRKPFSVQGQQPARYRKSSSRRSYGRLSRRASPPESDSNFADEAVAVPLDRFGASSGPAFELLFLAGDVL